MPAPKLHTLVLCALITLLCGCTRVTPAPLTVDALKMPAEQFPGVVEIITKSSVTDTYPAGTDDVPGMIKALRRINITSSAYYRYLVDDESGRHLIKVKINVFTDADAAEADWQLRYGPAFRERAEPVALGDEGLRFGSGELVTFRRGAAHFEFKLNKNPELFSSFVESYAAFTETVISRQR